ncbi:MAG TPA: N(4)-(beta-N-acetylglucosaminyl)-L-asparaginase [Humisphaera sp.]|jgi:N4-(beta-N-acetylglucosaminyl)-L-asparaginase|nr:N(4)-(beta-N-acetylglucosaminyl)-L-asparaginase [Humisphaera sp.]
MTKTKITRRGFVAAAGASAIAPTFAAFAQAPQALTRSSVKPVVISAANGNQSKDADGDTAVSKAFKMITGGSDVLDAVIAGVNIVELDPQDTSVGYGGLPNADGIVQLDSSVMHGPLKRAGAVACLEGVRTPSLVARAVMDQTDHHLLVGRDAQRFARDVGFKIEDDLNTEKSRQLWLEWKRRTDPLHYIDPKTRSQAGFRVGREMVAEGLIDPDHFYGTINCNAVNARGEVAGVTTTSGLAFKIPGRVGDSPIIGAGLYVDGPIGAAGSTGRGEANLFSLCSFMIVEAMRNGMSPKDAAIAACKRIVANTIEKRLLNSRGQPNFNVSFYALNVKGEHAGVSLYARSGRQTLRYAVCDADGPRLEPMEGLFADSPEA